MIGPDGEQLGIMSAREAMAKAQEAELDLSKDCPYRQSRRYVRSLIMVNIKLRACQKRERSQEKAEDHRCQRSASFTKY